MGDQDHAAPEGGQQAVLQPGDAAESRWLVGSSRISSSAGVDQDPGQGRPAWPGPRRGPPTGASGWRPCPSRSSMAAASQPSPTAWRTVPGGRAASWSRKADPHPPPPPDRAASPASSTPASDPQQGRLAGAVDAHHAQPVAVGDGDRQVGEQGPVGPRTRLEVHEHSHARSRSSGHWVSKATGATRTLRRTGMVDLAPASNLPVAGAWPTTRCVVVSFGGPEGPDDVMPLPGKRPPGPATCPGPGSKVAEHYLPLRWGLARSTARTGPWSPPCATNWLPAASTLPVYWGNRNWDPFLADTVRRCATTASAGRWPSSPPPTRPTAAAASTSTTSPPARAGRRPGAPGIDQAPPVFQPPGFVEPWVESPAQQRRSRPRRARPRCSSAPTASRRPWPRRATTRPSCARRPGSSRGASGVAEDAVAAGLPEPLGTARPAVAGARRHRTSSTALPEGDRRRSSWRPSGSCPTTWRSSTTSTPRRAAAGRRRGLGWCGPPRRAPTPGSSP